MKLGLHLLGELGGLPGHVGRVDTDRACNSSLEHMLSDICAREASSPMSCFYDLSCVCGPICQVTVKRLLSAETSRGSVSASSIQGHCNFVF